MAEDRETTQPPIVPTDLVVDVANVMGSRPDGWWRDRATAAGRLLAQLAQLPGRRLPAPPGSTGSTGSAADLVVDRVLAVVEGRARAVPEVPGVVLVRAAADGDSDVVRACVECVDAGRRPIAVTADRGLRARLPVGAEAAGPGWLRDVLDRLDR
jgi:hypothetical protein